MNPNNYCRWPTVTGLLSRSAYTGAMLAGSVEPIFGHKLPQEPH